MISTVYINGRFLSQRITGVQRYAWETLNALDLLVSVECPDDLRFIVLAPPSTKPPTLRKIGFNIVGPLCGHAWEQITLPLATSGGILFNLGATGPLVKRNQLVTIHDASVFAVPYSFNWMFRTWYRAQLRVFAEILPLIITVSEFSKTEIQRYCRIDASRIRIVDEGFQHVTRNKSDVRVLQANRLTPGRFVLAVSNRSPHKNFEAISKALRVLGPVDFDVAIAGGHSPKVFEDATVSHSRIKLLGHVSDSELRALYENAALFVFPSLYEGFGIPPLEAMALGCPVIASNAASMPEVCGDAAIYVHPDDTGALATAIRRLMDDPEERQRMRIRGRAQAAKHSWDNAARLNLDVIRECVSRGRN